MPSHSAGEFLVNLFRAIGSPGYPIDETWLREMGWQSYDRADDPGRGQRQIAAVQASGGRRGQLAGVRVPTLVIHGAVDPLISVRGCATAAAIPGARLVIYPAWAITRPCAVAGDDRRASNAGDPNGS